ncbi:MAG: hypothetical protein LC657_10570 [Desulfobacteraceae bacterium]|nr:hypothetical protein [Desulfobacteraceae bacterium]
MFQLPQVHAQLVDDVVAGFGAGCVCPVKSQDVPELVRIRDYVLATRKVLE